MTIKDIVNKKVIRGWISTFPPTQTFKVKLDSSRNRAKQMTRVNSCGFRICFTY